MNGQVMFRFMSLDPRMMQAKNVVSLETGADPDDIVWLSTVDQGIATIMKSIKWKEGSSMLLLGVESSTTRNCAIQICERHNVKLREVLHALPVNALCVCA
jgi:selenocysteine lyase/cysteine desulfurase